MRNFRLNGWQRLGICLTGIYLIALHVVVFVDSKSPPHSTHLDPTKFKTSTAFHDWSVSSSQPVSEEEFRREKGLPQDYKLTEPEFLGMLPDKWVHNLRIRPYLCWLLFPPVLAWGFSYGVVRATKWVAIGGALFGESMFHRVKDASKVALVALVEHLRAKKFALLDTQWLTPHLAQFGAVELPRKF
jgi:hypothetical protein